MDHSNIHSWHRAYQALTCPSVKLVSSTPRLRASRPVVNCLGYSMCRAWWAPLSEGVHCQAGVAFVLSMASSHTQGGIAAVLALTDSD